MAHVDQHRYVELVRGSMPEFFRKRKVLEVGSLDINGSVREHFEGCDYVGIDVGEGPSVDLVVPGEDFDAPDGAFDVVISCECMEHNPEWRRTTQNMMRMLAPGGLFVLSCAAPGRMEHGTTRVLPSSSPLTSGLGHDHYRNLDHADFASVDGLMDQFVVWFDHVNWAASDYYLVGVKRGATIPAGWATCEARVTAWVDRRSSTMRGRIRRTAVQMGLERSLHLAPMIGVRARQAAKNVLGRLDRR